jgi:hypothetical protein
MILLALLAGCTPAYLDETEADSATTTEDPGSVLVGAQRGQRVHVVFRDGSTFRGVLVEPGAVTFTVRGIGWNASEVATYAVDDVVRVELLEPPDPDIRY